MVSRITITFLLFLLTSFQNINGQGFEMTFGGQGTQICNGIILGADSSVYMLGFTSIGPLGGTDFMLSKISSDGNLIWTRFLGTSHDDFGISVLTTDNGLVLAGTTHDPIFNDQILLIVTDTAGIETARYNYGTLSMENINSARKCPDGGYLLSGSQSGFGSNNSYVLKLDSAFNTQWDGAYGAGLNDYSSESVMINNSTFYVVSDRKINLGGGVFDYDICILRTDSNGYVQWDSVYTDPFQNGSQGIFQSTSGNLITYGETEIYQFSPFDYFISSVDTNGNLQWRSTFGGSGSNALFDVIEDVSGNFIGTGYGNSFSNGSDPLNLTIVKIDPSGNLIWQREYGYSGVDIGFRIIAAPDGGFYVAGRASTVDDDDFYLLRVDVDGLTSENDENMTDVINPSVFPNPFISELTIKASLPFTQINLYDVQSRLVFSHINAEEPLHLLHLNIPHLTQGLYLLELSGKNAVPSHSIIIKN